MPCALSCRTRCAPNSPVPPVNNVSICYLRLVQSDIDASPVRAKLQQRMTRDSPPPPPADAPAESAPQPPALDAPLEATSVPTPAASMNHEPEIDPRQLD